MVTLAAVLRRLGDPRAWTLPAEALALLEPLQTGPELVAALTEVAAAEILQGHNEAGIGSAERALVVAEVLGLDRPARALGYRGLARCDLVDPGGLEDMREATLLATRAGQGREVANLHNNLAFALWGFEGPAAVDEVLHRGIAFARARGLTEIADSMTAGALDGLIDLGRFDEALELAAGIVERLEVSGAVLDLVALRAVQARIWTLRGGAAQVADSIKWLESTSRGIEAMDHVVVGLASSAFALAGLGQGEHAATLLAEIEAMPDVREDVSYGVFLPAMTRTSLALGAAQLAARLVAGVESRLPYAEHSLVAANAALAEARGETEKAAVAYAEAASRWEGFGVVPEQGFALLGQGRCLLELSRPAESAEVLRRARELFARCGMAPALAETDNLLVRAIALSS
jgi:tetratricopeptide (TPR) repeat protein